MRDQLQINKYSKSQHGYYSVKMKKRKKELMGENFFPASCQWLVINSLKLLKHYVMREPNHLVACVSTSPPRQRH